jgi:hypothetical protein
VIMQRCLRQGSLARPLAGPAGRRTKGRVPGSWLPLMFQAHCASSVRSCVAATGGEPVVVTAT